MNLILVNPSGRENYQELGNELMAVEPPLWCRLIAGYCEDKGHKVEIIDNEAENLTHVEVGQLIAQKKPDLVGMIVYGHQPNSSTQQMVPASKTCLAIKGFSNVPIIIAGGHVSVLPEQTLIEEHVDYVAIGEGAVTIERLLDGENITDIPGLAWIQDGNVWINPPPPLLTTEQLHGDVWKMLPMDKYRAHNWHAEDRSHYASIYTSLGCPYSCQFCCINAPFGGPGYRTRSPLQVVSEIAYLYIHYGVINIKIIDEMFILKPSHYVHICEGIANLPFANELNIWAYARVDTINEEHLPLLRKAGIRWLALGIESGSEYVRDGSEKNLKRNDIFEIVKMIQKHDINVIGNFIYGLPDDTTETMNATLAMALDLGCDFVNFYVCQAYPGSKLYEIVDKKDLPESWSGYSQHGYECKPLPTKTLTSEEVLKFRDESHQAYFLSVHKNKELSKPLRREILE